MSEYERADRDNTMLLCTALLCFSQGSGWGMVFGVISAGLAICAGLAASAALKAGR